MNSELPPIEELQQALWEEDSVFQSWARAVPDRHWAKYDISALRIGFELGKAYARPAADAVADARSPSYDALLLIAQSVCGALARAGITDCDDPGEAIDVMRERYAAASAVPNDVLRDAERLDFVLSQMAWIRTKKADSGASTYWLESQDEDEDFIRLSGPSFHRSPRAAIDAAMLAASQKERGDA